MHPKSVKAQREQLYRAAITVITGSRRDADVSQEELARRLGWSRSKVAALESHSRRIELPDFVLIAKALEIDPETLFRRMMRW